MRKILFLSIALFLFQNIIAQDLQKIRDSILSEAKQLYRSEFASWNGTDIFLEKYPNKDNIGAYFSYADSDVTRCVFYSRSELPKVIGTMTFDANFNIKTATVDLTEREFNSTKITLYQMRQAAYNLIHTKNDFFKYYNNIDFNYIPIIINGEKRVYILSGTSKAGTVLFGNDYLLEFDNNNQLTNKRKFHSSLIPTKVEDESGGKKIIGGIHNHLPEFSPYISATDICTLMLYSPFTPWQTYTVVSEKYLSNWDCKSNQLAIVPLGK